MMAKMLNRFNEVPVFVACAVEDCEETVKIYSTYYYTGEDEYKTMTDEVELDKRDEALLKICLERIKKYPVIRIGQNRMAVEALEKVLKNFWNDLTSP